MNVAVDNHKVVSEAEWLKERQKLLNNFLIRKRSSLACKRNLTWSAAIFPGSK
jgi:hypothetical protein